MRVCVGVSLIWGNETRQASHSASSDLMDGSNQLGGVEEGARALGTTKDPAAASRSLASLNMSPRLT